MPGNPFAVSVRVAPLTGRKASGQSMHDSRSPKHRPSYLDPRCEGLNSHSGAADLRALRAEIAAHRKSAGQQKLRADAQIVVAGVLTFGTEAQKTIAALTFSEQDLLFERLAKRVSLETGHALLTLDIHRDETALHAHFMLRGYSFDRETGKENSWRKSPTDLKALQDAVADEVESLGIERGFSREMRLAAGDSFTETIHKSVKALHVSLPDEIAKVQVSRDEIVASLEKAREKVQEAEAAVLKAEFRKSEAVRKAALAEVDLQVKDGALQTLQKRIETYERRAKKAAAVLEKSRVELKSLEKIAELPVAITMRQALPDDRSFFQKVLQQPARTETVKVYKASDASSFLKKAEALKTQAQEQKRVAEQAFAATEKRHKELWDYLDHQAKKWLGAASGPGDTDPAQEMLKAIDAGFTVDSRYGVALAVMSERILIPPQTASAKQKAAALYTSCKEKGWEKTYFFGLSEEVAGHIREMAKDDGRLEKISFEDVKQEALRRHEMRGLDRGPEIELSM